MANNFDLSALALQMACPGNVQILDDKGLPGAYVPRQAMQLNALLTNGDSSVHPAFLYNGVQKDTIYIGKYMACVNLNRAYSLPGMDPRGRMNMETASLYCRNKGSGHHLLTISEWAFNALLARKRGTMPKGNTNFGKDINESLYLAIPSYREASVTYRTATGTGPLTWSDTGDATGVMDLIGNLWELCAGIRLVRSELQVIPYNNAADPTVDMSASSTAWKAVKATATSYNDLYITPNGAGTTSGSVKLDYISEPTKHWQWAAEASNIEADSTRNGNFNRTTSSGLSDFCKLYLQAMALLPEDGATDYPGLIWARNGAEESLLFCGGMWSSGNSSGLFALNFSTSARATNDPSVGMRASYMEL